MARQTLNAKQRKLFEKWEEQDRRRREYMATYMRKYRKRKKAEREGK